MHQECQRQLPGIRAFVRKQERLKERAGQRGLTIDSSILKVPSPRYRATQPRSGLLTVVRSSLSGTGPVWSTSLF